MFQLPYFNIDMSRSSYSRFIAKGKELKRRIKQDKTLRYIAKRLKEKSNKVEDWIDVRMEERIMETEKADHWIGGKEALRFVRRPLHKQLQIQQFLEDPDKILLVNRAAPRLKNYTRDNVRLMRVNSISSTCFMIMKNVPRLRYVLYDCKISH